MKVRFSRAARAAAGVLTAVLLAGCDDTGQAPTTVVVNTPPADGAQMVLLTLMIVAAFLAAGVAGGFAWSWAQERRARRAAEHAQRAAEDVVLALTGQPIDRVRLSIRQQPPAAPDQHTSPAHGPAIERWLP
ncbi:MAG: hypothetical protein ACT4O0_03085 [Pseudonocardia sp.]